MDLFDLVCGGKETLEEMKRVIEGQSETREGSRKHATFIKSTKRNRVKTQTLILRNGKLETEKDEEASSDAYLGIV